MGFSVRCDAWHFADHLSLLTYCSIIGYMIPYSRPWNMQFPDALCYTEKQTFLPHCTQSTEPLYCYGSQPHLLSRQFRDHPDACNVNSITATLDSKNSFCGLMVVLGFCRNSPILTCVCTLILGILPPIRPSKNMFLKYEFLHIRNLDHSRFFTPSCSWYFRFIIVEHMMLTMVILSRTKGIKLDKKPYR